MSVLFILIHKNEAIRGRVKTGWVIVTFLPFRVKASGEFAFAIFGFVIYGNIFIEGIVLTVFVNNHNVTVTVNVGSVGESSGCSCIYFVFNWCIGVG